MVMCDIVLVLYITPYLLLCAGYGHYWKIVLELDGVLGPYDYSGIVLHA